MRRDAIPEPQSDFETDPRFSVERDVEIEVDTWSGISDRLAATLVNFSRHGFCVRVLKDLIPGMRISLELTGWPSLAAQIAWSHDGYAGCRLKKPLDEDRYEAMILSADAINRAGEWDI